MRQHERDRPDLLQGMAGLFRRAVRAAGEADVIARVRDDDQAERAGALKDPEVFRVVERCVLIGRVNLDSAQPQRLDPVQLLPPVGAVRVDAAEREQIRDKDVYIVRRGCFVDMRYLLRLCCDRQNDGPVNACRALREQQPAGRSVGKRREIALTAQPLDGCRGDLIGKGMRVKINNHADLCCMMRMLTTDRARSCATGICFPFRAAAGRCWRGAPRSQAPRCTRRGRSPSDDPSRK